MKALKPLSFQKIFYTFMNTKNLIFFSATISASFLLGCASWNNPLSPAQLATEPAPIAC